MDVKYKIAVLAGDGIGPEVMREAIKVLQAIESKFEIKFEFMECLVGWAGIDATGKALPDETLETCKKADAILFGSVGLPHRDPDLSPENRPERAALLRLRKEFSLFANLRPVRVRPSLFDVCPLKNDRIGSGIDILIVRELTGGLYFGRPKLIEFIDNQLPIKRRERIKRAIDTMTLTETEIENIARVAFNAAQKRNKKVTSIDKANVLENGVLWREVVSKVSNQYPDVKLEHMFVDNAALQLMLKPNQFDVMVCENTFGDILSDEAAALSGSLGMLPSASLGETKGSLTFGLYEPAGGSAPDIAGKNIANPIAQILSAALMLRYSFGQGDSAVAIERAIDNILDARIVTPDICPKQNQHTYKVVSTTQMGDLIAEEIIKN